MAYRGNLSRRRAYAHYFRMLALLVLLAGCAGGDLTETSEPQASLVEESGDFPTLGKGNGRGPKKDRNSGALTAVVISPASASLQPGATQKFAATAKLSDGATAAAQVTWTATGGTIDTSGVYTSGTPGSYRVIARSLSADIADTATVTVTASAPSLVALSVSPASVTLQAGATQRFAAAGKLSDGTTTVPSVTWTATGGTIASDGLYTAGGTAGGFRVIAKASGTTLADTVSVSVTRETGTACADHAHTRRVDVGSTSQLSAALAGARAGDLIVLADGTYIGHFTVTTSGTTSQRITLCGTRNAKLSGGGVSGGGYALTIQASYWTLQGFTVTNTHQGVRLERSRHGIVRDLAIHTIGQEALNLRGFSKHNLIEGNTISNTGLTIAEYGEGIYFGTAPSKWATVTGGRPDQTDSNTVRGNTIGPYVRSELIDAKEGTAFNRIENNVFNGLGQVNDPATYWVDSWVEINGDDYVVVGNRGSRPLRFGFQTYQGPNGWGNRTYYSDNVIDLNGAQVAGPYGIYLSQAPDGVIVKCDNSATGGALSNVACR
jgi:hypothetical protein